jgi:peptidoglycan/LPS O-acetylase OafA/YrhL
MARFFHQTNLSDCSRDFTVALLLAVGEVDWNNSKSVRDLTLQLLFLHNFSKSHFYGLNPSFWTIAVEIQLYVLYPVLSFLAGRIGWFRTLAITGITGLGLRVSASVAENNYGASLSYLRTGSPPYFWFSWTIGAYAAELYRGGQTVPKMLPIGLFVIVLGFAADVWKVLFTMSFPLVAAGTAALLISGANLSRHWRRAAVVLGLCSYSLYLIHQPLLLNIAALTRQVGAASDFTTLLFVAAMAVAIVPMAWVLFQFLERPSIKLGQRLSFRMANGPLGSIRAISPIAGASPPELL